MKTAVLLLLLSVILICSCEENEIDFVKRSSSGLYLVAGNEVLLSPKDIDYYDYSSHLIYLNNSTNLHKESGQKNFTIYADGDSIYSGQFLPGYSSHLPSSPVIHTPHSFYGDKIVGIDVLLWFDHEGNLKPDPRKDERIINALKRHNQYHSGLECKILSINYRSSSNVEVELRLTNNDSFNYYYLDPDKIGVNLFHYYTNGLHLYDMFNETSFTHNIEITGLESWNSDNQELYSLIKNSETKNIIINYTDFEQVPTGNYIASFNFPGITVISDQNNLQLEEGKIWLGKIHLNCDISIE